MFVLRSSCLMMLIVAATGWAETRVSAGSEDAPAVLAPDAAPRSGVEDVAALSDAQLQGRIDQWGLLTLDERRELLTEINRRMRAAGQSPVVGIRGERRFGYRVRQPDGSVVSVERREEFVRYRELDPDQPFGVGFENRVEDSPLEPVGTGPLSAAPEQRPMPGTVDPAPASEPAPVQPVRQTTE